MGASGAGEAPITGRKMGLIDDALQVEDGGAAITATENGTSVDLGVNHAAKPHRVCQLFGNVSALDTVTGDETYELEVEQSADNTAWSTTGLKFAVASTGEINHIFGVSERYIRLKKTLAGTTPSITFKAWAIPIAA